MKVKKYYSEYNNWKTEKQWNKLFFTVIDYSKTVELWANQYCSVSSKYASPQNVRPMNDLEINIQKRKEKEKRHIRYIENKKKKEILKAKNEYASKLREEWHTEWQWLSIYSRTVNNNAIYKSGKTLNNSIGRNCCNFGSDYCYFHISDTTLITDIDLLNKLIKESNNRYYKNNSINK